MAKFLQARKRPGKKKKQKLWATKKTRNPSCNISEVTSQKEAKLPWEFNVLSYVRLRLPSMRNVAHSIIEYFLALCLWNYNYLKKPLIYVKNTIAPPFSYHLEQRRLKRRLHKLEVEFLKLHLSLPTKDTKPSSSGSSCSCQQAKTMPPIEESKQKNVEAAGAGLLPSLLPPPAPPPPPPPPPVLPPSFPLVQRLPLLKKVTSTQLPKAPLGKQEGPVQITLKDLLNVKLKKTTENIDKQIKVIKRSQGMPVITVSELRGVKLKSSKMPPKRLSNIFRERPNSPLDVRQHLRKVNMEKSPGGTPLYDRDNKENGTGLTPLMTKALRRKFQLANPKSPSPLRRSPKNHGLDHQR